MKTMINHISRFIRKEKNAVSTVVATILMVLLVVALLAPLWFIVNDTMRKPDIEGFWALLNKGSKGEERGSSDEDGSSQSDSIVNNYVISVDLACPCDMLILNPLKNERIGYTSIGANRKLCREMENAELLTDNGEIEKYRLLAGSNEVNDLHYQVKCFDKGKYNLLIQCETPEGDVLSLTASQIDVKKDEVHEYIITWTTNPPQVTIRIDRKNDGEFENSGNLNSGVVTTQDIKDIKNDPEEPVLDVTVEITNLLPAPIIRCITFDIYESNSKKLITLDQEITFTNGVGNAVITLPPGEYTYIYARDKLHTLRRLIDPLTRVDDTYIASFTGSKALISGNLNDDKWIDILDFGVVNWQYGKDYRGSDTPCGTPYPHADLNGDGIVDIKDVDIVRYSFLNG